MKNIEDIFKLKGYRPKTSKLYARCIAELGKYYLDKDLNTITINEINNFVSNYLQKRKKLKGQTVNSAISAFIVYFNDILDKKFDFSIIERPSRDSETVDILLPKEIIAFISSFNNIKHKLIATLMYSCALDVIQVVLIRLEDIKQQTLNVRNPKGEFERQMALGSFELNLVEQYLIEYKPSIYLFESVEKEKQYSTRSIQKLIKKRLDMLGLNKKLSTRSLRYSYISHLERSGYSLKNILVHLKSYRYNIVEFYAEITREEGQLFNKSPIDIIAQKTDNSNYELIGSDILDKSLHLTNKLEDIAQNTPFLNYDDWQNASKMAQVYVILHSFENSVRKFIELNLQNEIGANWWDSVKNDELNKKYLDRKNKEQKHKWISQRGNISPLYYLDWSDLVKIIRKKEDIFCKYVNNIKFIELRIEELELTRNIIAHNGIMPSQDDIDRIMLYFKDWCKQLGH